MTEIHTERAASHPRRYSQTPSHRSAFISGCGALVFIASVLLAPAEDKPFSAVEKKVKERTGHSVSWEQNQAAREESLAQARALLRKPLTSSSAVQIALLNNRDLQSAFDEIGLSFADLREARMLANPEADLAVSVPAGTLFEWSIAQNFLNLLMIPMRARVAREHLAAAQLRVSDVVIKIVAEVKSAAFEFEAGEALLERLRMARDAQGASLQLMQDIHAAGNAPDLKLVEEQAAYSQSRLALEMAEAAQREHREKLNRLLGLWGSDTDWKFAGALPDVPAAAPSIHGLETLAVANRLDLAAARAELTGLVKALGLEKTFRFVGVLEFGVASSHDADSPASTGPSVRLELPVFNQGQPRIARAEAQLRLAQSRFEQLAIGVRSDVRELRDRMLSKRDMALFYREDLLPTRRRILALTLLNYNAMLSGAFELFAAKREELEAERSWIEARRDYWIARAELERAVGGDLDAKPDTISSPVVSKSKTSHNR
jgi:outer membrane protein, heavy metal efflux system